MKIEAVKEGLLKEAILTVSIEGLDAVWFGWTIGGIGAST